MSQRLGEYLKGARVKAGLSLEQLSTRTRIRIENLSALEREELESLPADPYVRGFVKIVCRELRLSPEEGLALYSKLRSNTILPDEITWSEENAIPEPGALEKALQDPDRVMDFAKRARKWAIPVGAIVLLGLLTLVVKGGKISAEEDGAAEEMLPKTQRPVSQPPPAPATSMSMENDAGLEESGVMTQAAPEVKPDVPVIEKVSLEPSEKRERKTASIETTDDVEDVPALDAPMEEEQTANVSDTSAPELTSPEPTLIDTIGVATTPANSGEPIVLEILALRDAEVTLLLDGVGLPRKRSLIAGERKSWRADSLFVLSVSDGGAVLLKLDEAYLGSPGTDGELVTNLTVRK